MAYKHLTYYLRCQLAAFYKAGYQQKIIAQELGVSESTISRELSRNMRWNGKYCPDTAQVNSELRRKKSKKPYKLTVDIKDFIKTKLEEQWSQEQIIGKPSFQLLKEKQSLHYSRKSLEKQRTLSSMP